MSNQFEQPENYRNRELSWLEFDYRVLSEARDKSLPLFERLKFLSITASNLDEFFMIRVASLKDMVHAGYTKPDIAGMKPQEQLKHISKKTHELVGVQYSTYNRSFLPALRQNHMVIIDQFENLSPKQAALFVGKSRQNLLTNILCVMCIRCLLRWLLIRRDLFR